VLVPAHGDGGDAGREDGQDRQREEPEPHGHVGCIGRKGAELCCL
jgi:hypothetical protein